jgi:3-methyladenine DNA glycosylase AlkD
MDYRQVIKKLKSSANPKNVAGMARFGISAKNTLGVSMQELRTLGKEIGKDHELASKLWDSKIHEASILASIVDIPGMVLEKQMGKWVKDFDSWDICDQTCMNLFVFVPGAYKKCFQWSKRKEEFVKRTAFALMACFAVKDKKMKDKDFIKLFPIIKRGAKDERNFVKKAVNWALRQIGKLMHS